MCVGSTTSAVKNDLSLVGVILSIGVYLIIFYQSIVWKFKCDDDKFDEDKDVFSAALKLVNFLIVNGLTFETSLIKMYVYFV